MDQPGDELEDRRLAAAGRTDQRDEVALLDAQIGFGQRMDLALAAAVGVRHVFQLDEGIAARRRFGRGDRLFER